MLGSIDHKPNKKMLFFELSYDPIYKSYWTSWVSTKSTSRYSYLARYLKHWDDASDLETYQELIN